MLYYFQRFDVVIYKITNLVNGKIYVGQTVQTMARRWALHRHQSLFRNRPLYRAIRKYGINNFKHEILETLAATTGQANFNEREMFWIKKLSSMAPGGYNLTSGGDGKFYLSEETKARISQAHIGKKRDAATVEKMRLAALGNTNRRGAVLSDETKQRISQAQIGRKASKETKAKQSQSHTGGKAYNSKRVQCIETCDIFGSTGEAARKLKLQQTSISAVCRGARRTTGGLTFRFLAGK